jgi:hypothetical protein
MIRIASGAAAVGRLRRPDQRAAVHDLSPLLDTAHQITIRSPTTSETVVTTPMMPGLELHLPAGTVIPR